MRRSSGGIADSGIFGMLGTTVQCKADDKGPYCTFAKIMNVLLWLLILVGLFLIAKDFFKK